MKLQEIEFLNFKSIKDAKLTFQHNCMILVGKNEAGKSNILKGIAGGLSTAYNPTPKSKRKRGSDEKITEAHIDSIFSFSDQEIEAFIQYIDHLIKSDAFTIEGKNITNQDFIKHYCKKGIYRYDIMTGTYKALYYTFPNNIALAQNFTKLNRDYLQNTSGTIIPTPAVGESFLGTPIKLADMMNIFSSYITGYVSKHLPQVYYWKGDQTSVLPSSVSISALQNSPTNYPSIQTLFSLAGYPTIPTAFADAQKEDGDCTNLLENIAQKATTEFQKRWPDLKKLSFEFRKDGDSLLIKIKEKLRYNFDDRSDGFKHFVSILLMLSSQVAIKKINNAVILIDEPDNSLYPSAAKYLRDELIKLSSNNIVVYATHSPFMIDNKEPSRHVIVSKKDEISKIEPVTNEEASYQKDDVLLNAIGTSRFEFIKEVNLILEGGTDFIYFTKALETNKTEYKELKNFFKNIGITFVHGVSSIKILTSILLLAKRDIFILSDDDSPAEQARQSYQKEQGFQANHWYTFTDLGVTDKKTIEDFITDRSLFKKVLKEMGKTNIEIPEHPEKGIMSVLHPHLTKDERQQFKVLLAQKITYNQIDASYYTLLQALKEKIQNETQQHC